MTLNSSFPLAVPEQEIVQKIGDFRTGAAIEYAEALAAAGISKREDRLIWADQIEKITKEIRRIEKIREFYIEPFREAKRVIESGRVRLSSIFDGPIDLLSDLKEKLNGPYSKFMFKCKQEDEAEIRIAKERAEAEARKKAEAEKQTEFMAEISVKEAVEAVNLPKPVTKAVLQTGSVSLRMTKKLRLTDISKVPPAYLLLNESLAMKDLKAGISIPGVEIYEVPDTYVR